MQEAENMSKKLCRKCTNVKPEDHVFEIEIINDCTDCEYNGAWDEENHMYVYDKDIDYLGVDRSEAFEKSCCKLGESQDNGCYMFTCHQCGNKTNLYL